MKKVIRTIIIGSGFLLIIYGLIMLFVSPFSIGLVPIYVIALALIIYGIFFKRFKRIIHILILCFSLVLFMLTGSLAVYGNNDNVTYTEDAVIVLGKGLDGDKITPDLASRLELAVEYHQKNPAAVIVVSGGQGKDEKISEALAMERYLVSKGVPADKIIKEDKSTSTYENFEFSAKILSEKFYDDDYSLAFITNSFHIYRAERIAKSIGVQATHSGADIEWYTVPTNYMRELMALVKYLVL
ncbi:MAG: YdcF family protein [Clostridia bacterium]|nr:YdcF family protein [Clostridia bacterium]